MFFVGAGTGLAPTLNLNLKKVRHPERSWLCNAVEGPPPVRRQSISKRMATSTASGHRTRPYIKSTLKKVRHPERSWLCNAVEGSPPVPKAVNQQTNGNIHGGRAQGHAPTLNPNLKKGMSS